MKNFIFLLFILISSFILNSCNEYLDIKPKGYVIPQTVEDFERILNDNSLTKLIPDGIEKLSDDYYDPYLREGVDVSSMDYRLYFWLVDPYSNPEDMRFFSNWNMLYFRIYQYNAIINGIDAAQGATQQRKDIAKGRAMIGRAICYYYLNNVYGQIPKSKDDQNALGVPIVISNKITHPLPSRSSTNATFDFIVKDLIAGTKLVPISSLNNFQINKGAGYGWLARAYLTMESYELAGEAAQEALKINNKLLDYNTQFEMGYSESGKSYYLPLSGAVITDPTLNPENLHIITYDYTRGMAFQYIAQSSISAFDSKDLRRILVNPSYLLTGDEDSWDGRYMYMIGISYNYSIGPTTAEMYLILSESLAREKKYEEALKNINILRKTRIEKEYYQDLIYQSPKNTMLAIFRERRAELLFKSLRWFDMRRLQNDPEFGFEAEHELGDGKIIKLAPNSPRYSMTIPASAINDQITQNP